MRTLTRAIDRWIFGAYQAAPADLAVYRVLYAGWMLLAIVPVGLWVDGAPHAFSARRWEPRRWRRAFRRRGRSAR
jgi:MFS-type transporter involved in bile tolerance (Atg22 family)